MDIDYFAEGLATFAANVRAGSVTFETATRATLGRIGVLDPHVKAFECVDETRAVETARSLDQLLANGTDLGPLMGVTVAVKDIIAVDGLPTTNGSNFSAEHLRLAEGTLIKQLRAAGCVIIGKTKTVEFALGGTGINESRGTPWNPWDAKQHRIPGGSSSGSAVAVATGLCGFALGTDTGGSVRIPACYNGLMGHKTTVGLWPTDGIFPLSATFDSVGPICRTAADAAAIHQCITSEAPMHDLPLKGLRFGLPRQLFFDDLDAEVRHHFDKSATRLQSAGVEISEFDIPEAFERETVFPTIVGAEIIAAITPDDFQKAFPNMDKVTRARAALGLDVTGVDYVLAQKRMIQLQQIALEKFAHLDAWISPTCLMQPVTIAETEQDEVIAARALLSARNTQPTNLFGQCAASVPIPVPESSLPVGFHLMLPAGQDSRLLAICRSVQECLGSPAVLDAERFIASKSAS